LKKIKKLDSQAEKECTLANGMKGQRVLIFDFLCFLVQVLAEEKRNWDKMDVFL